LSFPTRRDRRDAAESDERGLGADALGVVARDDEHLRGDVGADAERRDPAAASTAGGAARRNRCPSPRSGCPTRGQRPLERDDRRAELQQALQVGRVAPGPDGQSVGGLLFGIALFRAGALARRSCLLAYSTTSALALLVLPESFDRPFA
jgi:hypothetical protein